MVIAPAAAPRTGVLKEGLQPVERVGEAGLRRLVRLELLPPRPKACALVGREQREDAVGGGSFALRLGAEMAGVIREGVAGVDLHEVVHGQHLEDGQQVDFGGGVLGHDHGGEHEMPGMLGGILEPRRVGQRRAAQDGFELVRLEEKGNLLRETIGHGL